MAVMTIRVFLADDHEVVRRGVRDLIDHEDDMSVVGEASSGEEALTRIALCKPDVAVLDVRLGEDSGIEVARDIRSAHPDVRCLMLTSFADDEALVDSIVAGAAGYVLKQVRGNELLDGIRRVAAGESLLDPAVTTRVLDRLRHADEDDRTGAGADFEEVRAHLRKMRVLGVQDHGRDTLVDERDGAMLHLASGLTLCMYIADFF